MSSLGEKLKTLRKNNKLTQTDMANILGVKKSSISKYENNVNVPDIKSLIKLSNYFEISLDSLVDNSFELYEDEKNFSLMLSDRIKECRLELRYNQPELARILNVTKQTISNWEKGVRIPDAHTLLRLSDLFNCSVDYLLGKTDNKHNFIIDRNYNTQNMKIELDSKKITLRRKQLGLTQKELGSKVNLTEFNISKYERGATKPDIETLFKLAEALNCSIYYLLRKPDNEEISIEEKYNDNIIKIEVKGNQINLNQEKIQNLINKLVDIGLDIDKLTEK